MVPRSIHRHGCFDLSDHGLRAGALLGRRRLWRRRLSWRGHRLGAWLGARLGARLGHRRGLAATRHAALEPLDAACEGGGTAWRAQAEAAQRR